MILQAADSSMALVEFFLAVISVIAAITGYIIKKYLGDIKTDIKNALDNLNDLDDRVSTNEKVIHGLDDSPYNGLQEEIGYNREQIVRHRRAIRKHRKILEQDGRIRDTDVDTIDRLDPELN